MNRHAAKLANAPACTAPAMVTRVREEALEDAQIDARQVQCALDTIRMNIEQAINHKLAAEQALADLGIVFSSDQVEQALVSLRHSLFHDRRVEAHKYPQTLHTMERIEKMMMTVVANLEHGTPQEPDARDMHGGGSLLGLIPLGGKIRDYQHRQDRQDQQDNYDEEYLEGLPF